MRSLLTAVIALTLAAACSHDTPSSDPDHDTSGADAGADTSDDSGADTADAAADAVDEVAGARPTITPPAEGVALLAGGSTQLALRDLVSDPDTAFEDLTFGATSSEHVTAAIVGEALGLVAADGFLGTEQVGLEADDGSGPVAASITVEVSDDVFAPDSLSGAAPSCETVFTWDTFHGGASSVSVAGEFNGWSTSANPLQDNGDGTWSAAVTIPAGEYGYKLVLNGDDWREDPESPYRIDVDSIRNSLVVVPDCGVPRLELVSADADPVGATVTWVVEVYDSSQTAGLDAATLELAVNGEPVRASEVTVDGTTLTIARTGLALPNRYTLRGSVSDVDGRASSELYAPVWLEASAFVWEDAIIYFAFVDRLRNGDAGNDAPQPSENPLTDWLGGDWAGLLDLIEAGYFEDLGVNTLWITAPNDNPDTLVTGSLGDMRTAYHGYFPSAARAPENHFGTLDDLRAVVDAAHARGLRIITDFVANHVFDTHSYYTGRASDDEFNTQEVCRDINWERPITCWFEPYLPDFNYGLRSNVRRSVDDALWWIRHVGLDGFRMDAVKHMNHNLGYLLRAEIDRLHGGTGLHFFMLGETFTGLWSETEANLLAEYISEGELSGQFNFPLYFEIVRTVLRREEGFTSFASIDNVVGLSEGRFAPPAIMGTFAGNHDVPRLTSHAAGQIGDMWGNGSQEQALNDPPAQPGEASPYRRAEMALTLVMTLPGVPTLYYGDEIGLAGAGDPDNRRFLPEDSALNAHQLALRQRVSSLGQLRRDRVELRRGDRTTLSADGDVYVFARHLGDDLSLVAISNADAARVVTVPVSAWLSDGASLSDALDEGPALSVSGGEVSFELPAAEARVFTTP